MKLCMGCMNEIEDNLSTCPLCGFNESSLRQESYYLDPGTIIGGKYIVGRVLNYGGHTISYLGMDAEHNRKVVVREYLPSDFSTRSEGEKEITIYSGDAQAQFEQGLTNFLNESNRIQSLRNPEGIAKVYDCIAENDTGYVISEYVKGTSLKELLGSGKRYSVKEAMPIITQVLKGLSKVHPLDIIHCDISPETIMIADTGEVKLMDFGSTRYITTANSKSLAIILKQGYAPEEQYRSRGVRGPWTDVYAVAAVMYRMITGIVPQESVERALKDDLKEPSKLGISIPVNIESALMNALNVYQNERTSSAGTFLNELNSSSVKRIKTKNNNSDTGRLPSWAKIMVACLLCLVIAGGVYLKLNQGNYIGLQDSSARVEDWTNKSIDEIDSLEKQGIKVTLKSEYSRDKNNLIFSQSCDSQEKIDDLKGKEITFWYYTNEFITYRELNGLNIIELSNIFDGKTLSGSLYEKVDSSDGLDKGPYYDIKEIHLKNGTVIFRAEFEKNSSDSIRRDDIERILYYADNYLKWEAFNGKDFIGKKIDEVDVSDNYFMVDKEGNETLALGAGDKMLLNEFMGIIDQSYYSFDMDKGYIFGVGVDDGVKVVTSEPEYYHEDGKLFHVVGEKININTTVDELKNRLKECGFGDDMISVSNSSSNVVASIDVTKNGQPISCFKPEDGIKITIATRIITEERGNGNNKNSGKATTESPSVNTTTQEATTAAPTTESDQDHDSLEI